MTKKAILFIITLLFTGQVWAESKRTMVWELRFGLYKPSVDSEFSNGASPYSDIFGDSRKLMFQTELGYEV